MPEELTAYLKGVIGSVDSPGFGYRMLFFVFAILAILIIAFALGKSKTMLALVGLYISAFISSRLDFLYDKFDSFSISSLGEDLYVLRIILFVIIFSGVIFILSKSFMRSKLTIKESKISAVVVMTLLSVCLLISIFVSYIPEGSDSIFPGFILILFGSNIAQFIWALLPAVYIMFMKKED